jgi:hypothetical protein
MSTGSGSFFAPLWPKLARYSVVCVSERWQRGRAQKHGESSDRQKTNLTPGSASHSAEGKAFSEALGYYGEKDAKNSSGNSVYIKQGATSTGNPAEIGHNSFTGSDTVTFDFNQIKSNGGVPLVEMAATVGHEGQHGEDDAARRKAGTSESVTTVKSTEENAYRLQSFVYQGLGTNSPYGLWRSDWPTNEVEQRRGAAVDKYSDLSAKNWLNQ